MESDKPNVNWQELLKAFLHEKQHKEFLKLKKNKSRIWNIPGSQSMSREELDKCFKELKKCK